VRVQWRFFRSQAAVGAVHCGHPDGDRLLRRVARDVRRLRGEGQPWIDGLAMLLDSNIARIRGDLQRAKARLGEAAAIFDGCEMAIWAGNSRWILGHLLGGDHGRQMVKESERTLAPLQTSDRPRMLRMLAPGFDPANLS